MLFYVFVRDMLQWEKNTQLENNTAVLNAISDHHSQILMKLNK